MGMIITQIKRLPEGRERNEWANAVHKNAQNYVYENDGEGFVVKWLKEEEFDAVWHEQENIKDTPEYRQKYLDETKKGNVLLLEIDL